MFYFQKGIKPNLCTCEQVQIRWVDVSCLERMKVSVQMYCVFLIIWRNHVGIIFLILQYLLYKNLLTPGYLFRNSPDVIGFKSTAAADKPDSQIIRFSGKLVNIPAGHCTRLHGFKCNTHKL